MYCPWCKMEKQCTPCLVIGTLDRTKLCQDCAAGEIVRKGALVIILQDAEEEPRDMVCYYCHDKTDLQFGAIMGDGVRIRCVSCFEKHVAMARLVKSNMPKRVS